MTSEPMEITRVKSWLEKIVINYNFCPFAKKPFKQGKIRYFLSEAKTSENLIGDIIDELILLKNSEIHEVETTIMILPHVLVDFKEYNNFSAILDQLIASLKLKGVIQIATFHPDYQFADLAADDVRNYTNRSPYPLFHLIREVSVEKARETYPDIEKIPQKNMDKLEAMGLDKIQGELDDI